MELVEEESGQAGWDHSWGCWVPWAVAWPGLHIDGSCLRRGGWGRVSLLGYSDKTD